MSLKAGIVGLPNVGKSTLFNALSAAKAQAANFPFCTIEPNVGIITVPDKRLTVLEECVRPQRTLPATIEIVDIAGLVRGASQGEGLGNQFLSNIRDTDAIIHVIRCFEDDNIVHVGGNVDALRDKEVIDTELQLKDIDTVEKKISRLEKQKKSGDKQTEVQLQVLQTLLRHLSDGNNARGFAYTEEVFQSVLREMHLLTIKPVLYVCNVEEHAVLEGNIQSERIRKVAAEEGAEMLLISAAIESEIAQMDSYEDRQLFLEELGLSESGMVRLVNQTYKLLRLMTYFTCGVKEVRAWTIPENTTAPQAAGVIHSDFEKGFIRAEVIHYADFVAYGSEALCKEKGKMQVEGKEYIVQDGDIMHFRFNV